MTAYQEFVIGQIEADTEEVVGFVRHFPAERWDWSPGERWSAREHLNHARNVEQRYLERLAGVLAQGEYVPAPRPEVEPGDAAESPTSMAAAYAALRRREVETFRALKPAQWSQEFDHPTLWGRVSVEWWAERILQHTAEHLQSLWMLRQLTAVAPERLPARA